MHIAVTKVYFLLSIHSCDVQSMSSDKNIRHFSSIRLCQCGSNWKSALKASTLTSHAKKLHFPTSPMSLEMRESFNIASLVQSWIRKFIPWWEGCQFFVLLCATGRQNCFVSQIIMRNMKLQKHVKFYTYAWVEVRHFTCFHIFLLLLHVISCGPTCV